MSDRKKLGSIMKFDGAIMLKKLNDSHFKFYSKKQDPMPAIAEQVGFNPTGSYDHYYEILKKLYLMYKLHNGDRDIEWGNYVFQFIGEWRVNLDGCTQQKIEKLLDSPTYNFIADTTGMLMARLLHQINRLKKGSRRSRRNISDTQFYNVVQLNRSLLLDLDNEMVFNNQGKVPNNYLKYRKGPKLYEIVFRNNKLATENDVREYVSSLKAVIDEHNKTCKNPLHKH